MLRRNFAAMKLSLGQAAEVGEVIERPKIVAKLLDLEPLVEASSARMIHRVPHETNAIGSLSLHSETPNEVD